MQTTGRWLIGLAAISILFTVAALRAQGVDAQADPVITEPIDPSKEPLPIDPGGGQAAAMSGGTGGGGAAGTGSTTGAQPIANPFNFQTDLITGRFTYSIPIVVPPGRQGAQPTLALVYNSAGGNGWCGVGWNLDVGFIQRDTRRGVPVKWGATNALPEYDDAKCFVVNFGGVNACLVLVNVGNPANTFEYRAEVDSTFLNYLYYTNAVNGPYWQVTDKSGNNFYFGQVAASRMQNTNTAWNAPNQGRGVFRWALDRVVDVNGNETVLDYVKDANLLYLSKITYNGNVNDASITARNTVDFELIGRADKTISFQPGFRVETAKLLSNVVVKANGSLVRRYAITYTNSPSTFRTLLHAVTMFGSDGSSTLPAQTFAYQVKSFEFLPVQTWPGVDGQGAPSSSDGWYSPHGLTTSTDDVADLVDIDGDGLPDRVMRKYSTPYTNYFAVQRNTGSGFAAPAAMSPIMGEAPADTGWYSVRAILNTTSKETVVHLLDMNGDGFPDRIMRRYSSPLTNFLVQYNLGSPVTAGFSTTNGWGSVLSETTDNSWAAVRYGQTVKVDLLDLNGDGLPDRVLRKYSSPYDRFKIQLNTGSGFTSALIDWGTLSSQGDTSADWNCISGVNSGNDTYLSMSDINGDGLPDRVMRKINSPYTNFVVQFNNGFGFEGEEKWLALNSQGQTSSGWNSPNGVDSDNDSVVGLADINGDGLIDRVMQKATSKYTNYLVQFNTGSGFSTTLVSFGKLDDLGETSNAWTAFHGVDGDNDTVTELIDINGDGLIDRVTRNNTSPLTQWIVQLGKGPFPDLMSEARNGIGGKVTVTYRSSTEYNNRDRDYTGDPWTAGAISKLGFPVWTVSSLTVDDGVSDPLTTSYGYRGGYFDMAKREFRGFNCVTVFDPLGGATATYFHQSGGRDETAFGEFQDQASMAKKGIPYRIDVFGTNGNLYRTTLNKVEEVMLSTGSFFPFVSQTIVTVFDGTSPTGGSSRSTASQFVYDTTTGNATNMINLGEVESVNANGHTFYDTPDPKVYTHTKFATLANSAIRNKPESVKVTADAAGSTVLREGRFFYDGQRGNLTNRQVSLNGGFISMESVQYDACGNPASSTDAAGITTSLTYDTTKTFAEKQITATFTNRSLSDPRSGVVLSTTGPLGLTVSNRYDVFFRPIETLISTAPNAAATLWRTRTEYSLKGIGAGFSTNYVKQSVFDPLDTANGHQSFSYMDGIGRPIQARVEAETGQWRVSDTIYEERGSVLCQTMPRFETGTNFTALAGTNLASITRYDAVGRAFESVSAVKIYPDGMGGFNISATDGDAGSPVGTNRTDFVFGGNVWATVSTDPHGKSRRAFTDAYGRITNITEVVNGSSQITRFRFDLLGNLTNVTDHAGNQTAIRYDTLDRKTNIFEPNMGSWSYAYDNAGRLTNQIDAKGQRIALFYTNDPLGRLVSKFVYDSSSVCRATNRWFYDSNLGDTGFNVGKGQLYMVTDKEGSLKNSFDSRGRLEKTVRFVNVNGFSYSVTNAYDDADRVVEISYPNSVARVGFRFDTAGHLTNVFSLAGTGTQEQFYRCTSFNEIGQPASYKLGDYLQTTYTYYAKSKRLQRMNTVTNGVSIQDLTYKFDKVSNLTNLIDGVNPSGAGSMSISRAVYDDLYRLVQLTRSWTNHTWAYSSIGNIITNSEFGGGQYTYGSRPHAVTLANGKAYAYDLNGNMIARGAQTLVYDEENRLTQVSSASGPTVTFGYDGGGARLWRNSSVSGRTVWIGGLYEEQPTKTLCHVFAGGKRIATFEPQGGVFGYHLRSERWEEFCNTAEMAFLWPLQNNRAPGTVMLLTLFGILFACITARRGWRWNPNAAIAQILRRLLLLLGEKAGMRADQQKQFSIPNSQFSFCNDLTGKERRLFIQPLWRQSLSVFLIVAMMLATTETHIQAAIPNPVFYYFLNDHLGSSTVITNRSGALVQHYEYWAYGSERSRSEPAQDFVSNRYTGQILDDETGLYYYNARYYDPELGRFTQPDTIVPGATNPQNFNRYAYANNNPLNYIDPSGHGSFWGWIGAVAEANLKTAADPNTWIAVGSAAASGAIIGGAVGGPGGALGGGLIGAAAAMAIAHVHASASATAGYWLGPEVGYWVGFTLAVSSALTTLTFGIASQNWYVIGSAVLSLASASAGAAGEEDAAEYLGYAALAVSLAGAVDSALHTYDPGQNRTVVADFPGVGRGDEAQIPGATAGALEDFPEAIKSRIFGAHGDSIKDMAKNIAPRIEDANSQGRTPVIRGHSAGGKHVTAIVRELKRMGVDVRNLRVELAGVPFSKFETIGLLPMRHISVNNHFLDPVPNIGNFYNPPRAAFGLLSLPFGTARYHNVRVYFNNWAP